MPWIYSPPPGCQRGRFNKDSLPLKNITKCWWSLLLMVQKSQTTTVWMVIKPCKFLINYEPQLVSLSDFWTINSMTGWGGDLSYLVQAFLWRSRIFCMAVLRVLGPCDVMRETVSPASYFPPTSTVWTSEIAHRNPKLSRKPNILPHQLEFSGDFCHILSSYIMGIYIL